MGKITKIQYCDSTWSPWWGCQKVSPGCEHCFAERLSTRFGMKRFWGTGQVRRFFADKYWEQLFDWNDEAEAAGKRRIVFAGDMCDIFELTGSDINGKKINEARDNFFRVIQTDPWLIFLIVTKRPENILKLAPHSVLALNNLWIGVSAENQKYYDQRVQAISNISLYLAHPPFVSAEPLLGSIKIDNRISWMITGGETGAGYRKVDTAWVREIKDDCQKLQIPFFFKSWGDQKPFGQIIGLLDLREYHEYPKEMKR